MIAEEKHPDGRKQNGPVALPIRRITASPMDTGASNRASTYTSRVSRTTETECGTSDGTAPAAWPLPALDRYARGDMRRQTYLDERQIYAALTR